MMTPGYNRATLEYLRVGRASTLDPFSFLCTLRPDSHATTPPDYCTPWKQSKQVSFPLTLELSEFDHPEFAN